MTADPRLTAANDRYRFAKQRMTAASEAAIRGDCDAPQQADAALRELEAAQRQLRMLTMPKPVGEWAAWANRSDVDKVRQ